MLPFVEVSHLPSSASFYSAITQPLGLQYISAVDPVSSAVVPGTHSLTYGLNTSPPTPVFELRHVRPTAERPLRLSRLVFSASSPSVARRFQAAVQRFHEADGRASPPYSSSPDCETSWLTDDWRLSVTTTGSDMDGNTMDVVYIPPPQYPESFSGSTFRKTNSTEGEINRIMSWNYDVAKSDMSPRTPFDPPNGAASPPSLSARLNRYSDDDMSPVIRRTVTRTTVYGPVEPAPSPRQNSSGSLTAGAVVGLLGLTAASAAIGAGVAYGVMKDRTRQDLEPPMFQRRSTEPLGGPRGRDLGYERGERQYLSSSVADRRPPPTLLSRPPRDADSGYDDGRSRHSSSRFRPSGGASTRTRSEVSSGRKPLLLTDVEHRSPTGSSRHSARTSEMEGLVAAPADYRSHAGGSRHTSARSMHGAAAPSIRRSSTYDAAADADRDTYVSTRSHRTTSTVRGPPRPTTQGCEPGVRRDRPAKGRQLRLYARRRGGSATTTAVCQPRSELCLGKEGSVAGEWGRKQQRRV
ncbi:hypothetical protein M406DRAFT_352456 [Cryphonectria parasitica EP155]|uniref:Uncharacterized protein n=1 Tax=Cryphonectria parasitica (strain ATCC 38755 / EP155) TaxID=660469 RepID=A0A9P5CNB4_CRYP1|nr:uncharacterized protein M406DRAFT_352456 [Cryphonectria parasitica EP155]KAF3763730.1 hypothetical protein M406DRAFT_352456 [Cryphonectria parasitica EP155]